MRRLVRLAILTLVAVAVPRPGLAQGPPVKSSDLALATLKELMNITVTTATRRPEGAADVPARVEVVTAKQIRDRGYRSLADVLKDLADFKVDLAGDQDFPTELTVQGTHGASRVIVMMDGIRVSAPTGEPLPILANYPVHNARQVEVVYGPSSALYGADAFSAVINVIGLDAEEGAGVSVQSSLGQFGVTNQTAAFGHQLGSRASLVLSGQFFYDHQPDLSRYYSTDFQGLNGQRAGTFNTIFGPMTSLRQVSPAYEIPTSAHSVQATLRAGRLRVSLFENRSRVSTSPAYTPDNAVYNADAFNENTLLVGAGTYAREFGGVTSTSTLTLSRHELSPESGYWNVYSNLEKSYKYAYGSSARVEQQLSWKPAASVALTAGGSFEHFYAIPQGADLNAPIVSRDAPGTILDTNIVDDFVKLRYANTGAYAQLQYSVTPAVALTLGARGDYNTRFGATFNPRVGLVAHISPVTTLKLMYGTAYLAPSPYQEYSHYGSFYSTDGGLTFASDYWHLPNPTLRPQIKRSLEGSIVRWMGPSVSLSASAFVTHLTDLIQESDATLSYAGAYHGWPVAYIDFPVNGGRETTYGGTLGLDLLKSIGTDRHLSAHARLSLADGRVRNDQSPDGHLQVGSMSPVQLRFGADVDWGQWTAAPRLSVVGAQRVLATTTPGGAVRRALPGYTVADVTVRRRHVVGSLGAFLTVENLLDRRYRNINARAFTNPEELIGAPQNPRRITVGFEVRFR